jgi:hypothetical protein
MNVPMSIDERVVVRRYVNGVILNPFECVQDDAGQTRVFANDAEARRFLLDDGVPQAAIGDGLYIVPEAQMLAEEADEGDEPECCQ